MTIQTIRERFRSIGLGANLPMDGKPWSSIGELVHWSDLIGLASGGQRLCADESEVAYSVLQCIGTRIGVRRQDISLGLTVPVEIDEIATTISHHLMPKRGEGVVDEDGMELMRRILVRREDLRPLVLPRIREALKLRGKEHVSSRNRIDSDLRVLACLVVEFGTSEDLELIASVFHCFREKAQASILGAVHARGWHDDATWVRVISQASSMIQGLHDSLIRLRIGSEPSELIAWFEHSQWSMRIAAMECVFKILPVSRPGWPLFEMLLPRLEEEDDKDCGIMMGWVLGRLLEVLGASAGLEILLRLNDLPSKDTPGFHAGMRALVRLEPDPDFKVALLEALCPLESEQDRDVASSVRIVKMHLLGASICNDDLASRLSSNRGWLQDLCEPGRKWNGIIGDLFSETLATESLIWVCLGERCDLTPPWLRTLWLRRRLAEEPLILSTLESACRMTKLGENRRIAAMAILTYPKKLDIEDLYLACVLGKDLPLTVPRDCLENAVSLLNHTHDCGLEERAHEILVNGGPILREVAKIWYSAQVANDFDLERSTVACERLSMLGVGDSVRALPYDHMRVLEPMERRWSQQDPDIFLYGDLSQEEPEAIAMRLQGEIDHSIIRFIVTRLARAWERAPGQMLAAWEVLSESDDWIKKEAACILAQEAGEQFIAGRAGQTVRERLKVLAQDQDSDVEREAKEALSRYEITIDSPEP